MSTQEQKIARHVRSVEACTCGHPHGDHAGTYGSGECIKCGWRQCEAYRTERQSRGVEGELKPLPNAHRQCERRFCRKSALSGSAFCEDHSGESQPLKSTGRSR